MISQTSRKIVVASAMAAVVGIGIVIFALRSHPVARIALTPQTSAPVTQIPAATLRAAEIPAAPPPMAQIPDTPAAVAQVPDTLAAGARHDSVGTNSSDIAAPAAVWRRLARKQHLAKADTSAAATGSTVTSTGSAADARKKPAAEAVEIHQ